MARYATTATPMQTRAPSVISFSAVTASAYDPICGMTRTKMSTITARPIRPRMIDFFLSRTGGALADWAMGPTSGGLVLGAQQRGGGGHGPHLAVCGLPGQVFHAAVRGDDHPVRLHERQRPAHPVGHRLRALDRVVGQVDDAQDDGLAGKVLEDRRVEVGLRGLDRHLV